MSQTNPQPVDENQLTDKQRAFVLEYVKDWNATQAAIRAGYAESGAGVEGHRLLKNANIRAIIDRHFADMGITADRILAEQAALAYTDMKDYADVGDGGGVTFKSFDTLGAKTKAIRKIKEKRRIIAQTEGEGNEVIIDSQVEVELYDKQKSLDTLAKHVSGREKITAPPESTKPDESKQPAQQMVDLMAQIIAQAQNGQIDPVIAKTVSTLATALLKANEQGELEARLAALEALAEAGNSSSNEFEWDGE